ncbi:Uncharacterized protein GBIM_05412 [Gryllus bimaculatus]|nr:Uncharacterized protein GBIM_05412 [Gryllus bimaculatus]
MVIMAGMDEHERKIVIEFCHLLEKSKQLFNGLRDLPQYGHKQWQAYFGRTFDIYTKLWKFQQQHSLRTSETNYLNEAYSFYAAIRGRAYYSRAAKEDRSDLMVKKLRYYARFIVVCLLLKKMKLVRDLVMELDKQIIDYTSTYEPDDQLEWSLVLEEIKSFIKADGIVSVLHADSNTIVLSHRLSPLTTPPVEKSPIMNLTLQEILIVGNCNDQVKFSELTMDMFRMLQTLEREPQEDFNHIYDASPAPGRMPLSGSHKHYFAESSLAMGYDLGGVLTSSKKELDHTNKKGIQLKEMHCLYPGDLYPFTRKPFFVIVDSDNSFVFQHIPRYFGQPLVVLMSPQDVPPAFQDSAYLQFFGDDFLRLLLLRYVFCDVVLHLHRSFKGRQFRPRCQPPLPDGDLLEHPALQHLVLDLASHLEVRGHFMETNEMD